MTIVPFLLFALIFFKALTALPSEPEKHEVSKEYVKRREAMTQELSKSFKDNGILKALNDTSREIFLRPGLRYRAYMDEELPVEKHQFLSRPIDWARALEFLAVPPATEHGGSASGGEKSRVLVLDPGVGYGGALVSRVAGEAWVVVTVPELLFFVQERYKKLNYSNLFVKSGTPEEGWKGEAPYDRIFLAGSPEGEISSSLFNQLVPGGILLAPEGRGLQRWVRYRKEAGPEDSPPKMVREELSPCHFPPLVLTDENK